MDKAELIQEMDRLYKEWDNPYHPAARFHKAEEAIKLWPEIRPHLVWPEDK